MKAQVNFDSLGGGSNAQVVSPQISNNNKTISGSWDISAHFFAMLYYYTPTQKQIWLVNLDTLDWWVAYINSPYTSNGVLAKQSTKVNVQSNFTWTLSEKTLTIDLSGDVNVSDVMWILTEDIPSSFF